MCSRRELGTVAAAAVLASGSAAADRLSGSCRPPPIPPSIDQRIMRLAIEVGRKNPRYPFGAVIISTDDFRVLASGFNSGTANPIFHGEVVAMNDFVAKHGNQGWDKAVLYTTGEPCPMCMSAMVWAGMAGVVYGTTIAKLRSFGIRQILIPSEAVTRAAPFYRGFIRGPVLEAETDALFQNRERL